MSSKIVLGFESGSGEPVSIGITHTVFAGITRVGKSETVKTAILRSTDIRFLILDVKKPRDYDGLGVEIPIYIEEKTDPLMLKRLLESQSHLALKFEFPELLKVCKKEKTYKMVLDAVTEGLEAKVHPIVKDKLLVLQHLLSRLVKELEAIPIVDTLELKNRINVMDLSDVSKEIQQLAIHSTLKSLLQTERDVVVIADEFHRFAPQYGSNASKETITEYIKEGGAKNLWLWVIDQTITGIEKQVLKQCWIWVLGKQRELNEAKRTLDQIPFKSGLTDKKIMRLKRGHFIVCTEDSAKLTYVWLEDVPKDIAQNVALGKISVQSVINMLEKGRGKYVEEKKALPKASSQQIPLLVESVSKEKYEDLQSEVNGLKQELAQKEEDYTKFRKEYEEREAIYFQDNQRLILRCYQRKEQIKTLKNEVSLLNKFKELIREIIPQEKTQWPQQAGDMPSEVMVNIEQPKIAVTLTRKPLVVSDQDLHGKIAVLYVEGLFKDDWFSVANVVRGFTSHGWKRDPRISKALDDFTRWGYFVKKMAGRKPIYQVRLSLDEAKAKGLLEVKEA